jgi:hypothetical protein
LYNYSKISLSLIFLFTFGITFSQRPQFSLATDVSVLRSFKKEQQYWAVGQTVHLHFHFTPKDGAYAWISYYSKGKFTNALTANAKSPATVPQQINYQNKAEMQLRHVSLGWKRYLKGAYDSETKWNLYGYAGFGLMMGGIINTHSVSIDTAGYTVPVLSGKANFKRLTFDLGSGIEIILGGGIYFYLEGRALVPTTGYPSKHLFVNNNAPFAGAANVGIRILFN